ncbi:nucleoside 2-deoxyribosyltransferase [Streptomyces litchfieldiae]|uniref:Nucleoside 2-deoxyribosyltransferase n=1 Tax=Streptomyces litchfieldiae TaxID=3075543 RepID=A0ABU2MRH3_9ACTN|nr:nucleoside 2-deoxyribosyltransferase [Streptomyces sp. DSM 44938]MDT0344130.1 nucleoside 2-deoxyribosyltransferase [Streptomyces sp. DSM 44938]
MYYYVAHRLFAAHDRAVAAHLAQCLGAVVGPERVFLPFCDTDEEDLVADVKGRRLFELDRERLAHLDALIAVLHGPSLDDGVCMEIGYAAASGVPVTIVSTDFQTYSLTEDGPHLDFPDPLIQAIATPVIRIPGLSPANPAHSDGCRFSAFLQRNLTQLDTALEAVTDALTRPSPPPTLNVPHPSGRTSALYVEPSPYGDTTPLAADHEPSLPQRFTAVDPLSAARDDFATACTASRLLVDVSGPETPPGAAVLIGAAAARGVRIAAFCPRSAFTHAHGREPNWRNLMIQYAVETRLDSHEAVHAWLST